MKSSKFKIFLVLFEVKSLVFSTFAILIIKGLLVTLNPYLYSKFINTLVATKSFSTAGLFAVFYGVAVIGNICITFFETRCTVTLKYTLERNYILLKTRDLLSQFQLDYPIFPSEVDRNRKDIKIVSAFLSSLALSTPISIVRLLFCFYMVCSISKLLTLFLVVLPVLIHFLFKYFQRQLNEVDLLHKNKDSSFQGELLRYISKLNLVIRHASEPLATSSLLDSFNEYNSSGLVFAQKNYIYAAINQIVFFTFNISTMIVCGYLYERGQIEIGHIGLTLAYFGQFNDLLAQLIKVGRDYNEANNSFERSLSPIELCAISRVKLDRAICKQKNPQMSVNLSNLKRKKHPLLSNFAHTFVPGKIYQIRGDNGTGKSSLLHAMGMDPIDAEGQIFISSDKLNPLTLHSQNSEFYFDKIKENLRFFEQRLNKEKFENLLNLFFPEAEYESFIETEVDSLSGGQKQRLSLMLTFSLNSDIILLDEPFTGLDHESILKLKKLIKEECDAGRIIIIICHDQVLKDSLIIEISKEITNAL